MGRINLTRVILGGLLAGLVINLCEFLVNGLWLMSEWEAVMRSLGKSYASTGVQVVVFNLWGFAMGIVAVWLYAAIRPRFGPGPSTAFNAAVVVWLVGYALATIPPLAMGLFPPRLLLIGMAVGLVETIAGTNLGAWLYREPVEHRA